MEYDSKYFFYKILLGLVSGFVIKFDFLCLVFGIRVI